MEYIDWLEHAKTFFEEWKRKNPNETFIYPDDLLSTLESEIASERNRGDLAIRMTPPPARVVGGVVVGKPFYCALCGEEIKRQPHSCESKGA